MVDDLLDLSRLESGGWVAARTDLDVPRIARDAFEPLRDAAEAAGCSFEVSGSGRAVADPAGLVQVFRNLYENALRHTDRGGSISVSVRDEPEMVHVQVSDDGEGIPLKALPRIFERFYRADSSRARDQGGTGLGLAIVRHLVSSMGGSVWADSELGVGTTVHLTLPRAEGGP
jgi:two-component system phosphate regulon sensor histidine kinase PhoR